MIRPLPGLDPPPLSVTSAPGETAPTASSAALGGGGGPPPPPGGGSLTGAWKVMSSTATRSGVVLVASEKYAIWASPPAGCIAASVCHSVLLLSTLACASCVPAESNVR